MGYFYKVWNEIGMEDYWLIKLGRSKQFLQQILILISNGSYEFEQTEQI